MKVFMIPANQTKGDSSILVRWAMQHYMMLPLGSQMWSSPGALSYLIDIVIFEVKSKDEQNGGTSD